MKKLLKSKKVIMIAAMVLMVALVVGMGAMTYSRYVSSANMDATQATVAKWGYVVSINANNMFATKYETTDDSTLAVKADDGNDVVEISSDNSIVAPGTTGSMTITVEGEAEVLAALSIEVQSGYSDITLVMADGETTYQPVKWTLNDGTEDVISNGTLQDLVDELEDYALTIEAGQSISKTLTITWKWDLDSGNDKLDTILGYMAFKGTTTLDAEIAKLGITDTNDIAATGHVTGITFDIAATVKQIQD